MTPPHRQPYGRLRLRGLVPHLARRRVSRHRRRRPGIGPRTQGVSGGRSGVRNGSVELCPPSSSNLSPRGSPRPALGPPTPCRRCPTLKRRPRRHPDGPACRYTPAGEAAACRARTAQPHEHHPHHYYSGLSSRKRPYRSDHRRQPRYRRRQRGVVRPTWLSGRCPSRTQRHRSPSRSRRHQRSRRRRPCRAS